MSTDVGINKAVRDQIVSLIKDVDNGGPGIKHVHAQPMSAQSLISVIEEKRLPAIGVRYVGSKPHRDKDGRPQIGQKSFAVNWRFDVYIAYNDDRNTAGEKLEMSMELVRDRLNHKRCTVSGNLFLPYDGETIEDFGDACILGTMHWSVKVRFGTFVPSE